MVANAPEMEKRAQNESRQIDSLLYDNMGQQTTAKLERTLNIREQYVLAHSNNVDMVLTQSNQKTKLIKDLRFFKMITKR